MMARMRVIGAYITRVMISGRCFLCLAYYAEPRRQTTPMQHAVWVESKRRSRSRYDPHLHFEVLTPSSSSILPTPKPAKAGGQLGRTLPRRLQPGESTVRYIMVSAFPTNCHASRVVFVCWGTGYFGHLSGNTDFLLAGVLIPLPSVRPVCTVTRIYPYIE
ncbi:hypothetical protein EV401DRAFT_431021 [Pisolithus croceorrhizus]|nr:hypothetical protein EV401DRAFT_431021 [Pisolithus croceorrhizus]